MDTCFIIRQYASTIDLALTNAKDGPRLFQVAYGKDNNLTELIDFASTLLLCQQRGDTLIAYDSVRWGLRYLTDNIPVKLDGIGLALGHIDLLFWLQSRLPYEFKPLSVMRDALNQPENMYGTLDILQWLTRIRTGEARIGYSTWLDGLAQIAQEEKQQVVDPLEALTVGEVLVNFSEHANEPTDRDSAKDQQRLVLFYPYITWLFVYKDELEAWMKEKPHESRETFNDD